MLAPRSFQPTGTALPEADRRLHDALVAGLLATGAVPRLEELARAVDLNHGHVRVCLRRLEEAGYIVRDAAGRLAGVYPFAAVPADHSVVIGDQRRYAFCAVDALGIAAMLDQVVAVESSCAACGGPIRLGVRPGTVTVAEPATTTVVARLFADPAARSHSPFIVFAFACGPAHAHALAGRTPDTEVLPLTEAHALGEEIVEDLLAEGLPATRWCLDGR